MCLAGTARVFEIVSRESWNGAAPVIRESARRHILEQYGFRIACDRKVGAARQRTMKASESHTADAQCQAAGCVGRSGLEQQDVDAGLRQQGRGGGGRWTTSNDDNVVVRGWDR